MWVGQTSCDEKPKFQAVVDFVGTEFDGPASSVLDEGLVEYVVKSWIKGLTHILQKHNITLANTMFDLLDVIGVFDISDN